MPLPGARETTSDTTGAPAPVRGFETSATPESLRAAFDYRGDVTLRLEEGSAVEGYVANLGDDALVLWSQGHTSTRRIERARVRGVAFTGRDTAAGKSYETWLRQHPEPRESRAASATT